MTTYLHDAWQNGTTRYEADDMNAPLGQLDQAIYETSGEIQTGVHNFQSYLAAETGTPDADDLLVIYDDSASTYKKMSRSDFLDTGQSYGIGIYDMGISISSKPSNSQIICTYPMPRSVTFPYDCGSSRAAAGTAATAQTIFSLKKDGVEFATCTFAASGTTGSYSGEETTFTAGEVFTLVAPASADATLADIGFAVTGIRIT